MDGRLGDAPPPESRPRLGDRSTRACRASCAASSSTRASSPATIPSARASTRARSRASRRSDALLGADGVVVAAASRRRRSSGNTQNDSRSSDGKRRVTHLRLNIFPDGGVARLRVHGDVVPDERRVRAGAKSISRRSRTAASSCSCSDMHYGHRQNLIMPGRSTHMGDGWETKRRRGPGHDWSIVRLARRGVIERIELDTDHFKGNAPGSCMLECCDAGDRRRLVRRRSARRGASSLPRRRCSRTRAIGSTNSRRRRRRTFDSTSIPMAASRDSASSAASRRRDDYASTSSTHFSALAPPELLAACCGAPRWVSTMIARTSVCVAR